MSENENIIYRTFNFITTDQWIDILTEKELIRPVDIEIIETMYFNESNYKMNPTNISEKLDMAYVQGVNVIGHTARKIAKSYAIDLPIWRGDTRYKNWWRIFFSDEREGRTFFWILRPELVKAMDLIYHKEDESVYQNKVQTTEISEEVVINDTPQITPPKVFSSRVQYTRNVVKSKRAIISADYKCEIDGEHRNFISKTTNQNYVEAHHLIPMKYQKDFTTVSLDVEANIVSLCLGCHGQMHLARSEDKKPQLEKLYNERIERLNNCNIFITVEQLINYYE